MRHLRRGIGQLNERGDLISTRKPARRHAALLEAHVAFELARWSDDLASTVAEQVEALYAWLDSVALEDVAPADGTAAAIARHVEQVPLGESTGWLLAEIVRSVRERLTEDGLALADLVQREELITLVGAVGRHERVRSELIGALTSSTAYRRLVAHVLYRGVKAYVLTENVLARKIPGASSLVRFGQRSLNTAAPGLEKAVDTQLSAFVEANIAETLRESRRYLEATVDEPMVRAIAEEAWDAAAQRPLADLGHLVSDDDDLEELTERLAGILAEALASGRITPLIEATVADLLEEHAEDSPVELLNELGLSAEAVTDALTPLAEQMLTLPAVREYLESRIRSRLTAFYASVEL